MFCQHKFPTDHFVSDNKHLYSYVLKTICKNTKNFSKDAVYAMKDYGKLKLHITFSLGLLWRTFLMTKVIITTANSMDMILTVTETARIVLYIGAFSSSDSVIE